MSKSKKSVFDNLIFILSFFRDALLPLIKAGFFIYWENATIEFGDNHKVEGIRLFIAPPDGTEISISGNQEIVLNGKVLE